MRNWLTRIAGAWRAPRIAPKDAFASNDRGCLLLELGQARESEASFRDALSHDAAFAEAHSNLSSALSLQGRFDEAEVSSRTALQLDPQLPSAHVNLGNTMLYRGRYGEAVGHYTRALQLDPDSDEAHIHLALLGRPSARLTAAIQSFEERLSRNPASYVALTRLGLGYQAMGNLEGALEKFEMARSLRPELGGPWASLAVIHGSLGCPEESIALLRQALEINENPIWRSTYLFFLQYSDRYSAADVFEQHAAWGRRCAAAVHCHTAFSNPPLPERRLRIAYMSGDLYQHPVANFLEPILRSHDRENFEIHCYANVLKPDGVTDRLKSHCSNWHDTVAMPDAEVYDRIRDDGIDILVDLSGHTRGQRMQVLASKAAPVQVTYLGYPGSTGLAAVDYRITDSVSDPPGMTEKFHVEKPIRLDGCFLTYMPPPEAPQVCAAPYLRNGYITFGSFNNINKVNSRTIRLWSNVLHAVPGSRIVIKHFATAYHPARQRILTEFSECDIDPGRIQLLPAHPEIAGHLDSYREVDVALDCTPYNGTTTTCEALWMGVPVIVLTGDRHSARVGASLLAAIGLDEWIAATPEHFVAVAAAIAVAPSQLSHFRATLRQKMRNSNLMNAEKFTQGLEQAYRLAWRAWCRTR